MFRLLSSEWVREGLRQPPREETVRCTSSQLVHSSPVRPLPPEEPLEPLCDLRVLRIRALANLLTAAILVNLEKKSQGWTP